MNRVGVIATAVLLLITVIASTTLAAPPGPEFRARAGSGEPGRGMMVAARVVNARWGVPFAARAVVHFTTGDVTVRMYRLWPWHIALGRARIPADEPPGQVAVDVTIRYGSVMRTLHVMGTVLDPDGDEQRDPSPSPSPTPQEN